MHSVSFVIPCLNEANTIGDCVKKAVAVIADLNIYNFEVIVADNGSEDGSQQIAIREGAKVINVKRAGYGNALDSGIRYAQYDWIIFADGDCSYDFGDARRFFPYMNETNDIIIGNRFAGKIEKGAMPFLHRYIGTPVISFIGRRLFGVNIRDFNCGMRAIKKSSYNKLGMVSGGMEYATEMIARASFQKLKMVEVPVNLFRDGRDRKPHLNTWRDGWKHLRLILLLSPRWILFYPAAGFLTIGLLLFTALIFSYVKVFDLVLDIHTLYYASIMLIVGMQLMQFFVIAKIYAANSGLDYDNKFPGFIQRKFSFERMLVAGSVIFALGVMLTIIAVYKWKLVNFGPLDPVAIFRIIIPAGFCIATGIQVIVFGFLMYTMRQFTLK